MDRSILLAAIWASLAGPALGLVGIFLPGILAPTTASSFGP
ncbi:hypothetical protein [Bradyrhizobium sp. UFLA05-112]